MEDLINKTDKILRKVAQDNGYYMIPMKNMNLLYSNFEYLKTENKRLMKRNEELRYENKQTKRKS